MTMKSFLASALLSALALAPASAPAAGGDPIVVPASTPISRAYEGLYAQRLERVVADASGTRTESHLVIANNPLDCQRAVYDKVSQRWLFPAGQEPAKSCAASNGAINRVYHTFSADGRKLPPSGTVSIVFVTRELRPGDTAPLRGLVASNDPAGCLRVAAMGQISPYWRADVSGPFCVEVRGTLVVDGTVIANR
ncbi:MULTISPECIES: hypothetical protein [unclassified Lysobacter]|uniref:hypothetical protein n=1 Tax=unclassified Lysobacter TaxID=2635362 RepID=UPI001BE56324|nr:MULTISPECIES: hypothetical protein [unclassified Lysobacter]MBT2748950.1 hypothetical protein [Lysobacter sp. ISL-42]MBT2751313.1 hypothetical protein [Lysobacter sp. ISL-50]MBT2776517.1 hypothetical protein [Lysobacter sp. ISL-54]MBT2781012.1 hypothetical protein [Lysobacter sp. ISL-52]